MDPISSRFVDTALAKQMSQTIQNTIYKYSTLYIIDIICIYIL